MVKTLLLTHEKLSGPSQMTFAVYDWAKIFISFKCGI